jgi:hypothetical protein
VEIASHPAIRDVESNESDVSDNEAISSSHRRVEDPEWTPGSSYVQKKLRNGNTVDDITYMLRFRLVSRPGRETETDNGRAETAGSPGSEHTTVNTQGNTSPGKVKPATSHSYSIRSTVHMY